MLIHVRRRPGWRPEPVRRWTSLPPLFREPFRVRTCPASPNSCYVWLAKPPVSAACFASAPRTARGMWSSCHGRRISRPRADMTLAARMSPLPRTVMQQARLYWRTDAKRFSASEGRSGCYVFCLCPVSARILKSSLNARRGLNSYEVSEQTDSLTVLTAYYWNPRPVDYKNEGQRSDRRPK